MQRPTKRERSDSGPTKDPVKCLLDGNDTAFCLHHLEKEDLKTETLEVLAMLESEASTESIVFESFFLPLLRNLIRLQVPLAEPRYKNLFRKILLANATRYVQH